MCNMLDFLAPRKLSGFCTQTTNQDEGLKILHIDLTVNLHSIIPFIYYFIISKGFVRIKLVRINFKFDITSLHYGTNRN